MREQLHVQGWTARDNFHWRILRGLGKLLAWSVSIRDPSKEHGMNPTAQVAPEKFVET